MRLHLPDEGATVALARELANALPLPAVVHLYGDLGAGKSTLARALLRSLGVEGTIRSPTYTLVERYATRHGEAWHLDLYRIGDPGELEYLGLDGAPALWLVEWPERGMGTLPPPDLVVRLETGLSGRDAVLTSSSPTLNARLQGVGDAFTRPDLHG